MCSLKKDMINAQNGNMRAVMIQNKLEKLFYQRPQDEEERYGLHASAIIGCEADSFCYREQVLSLFYKMNQGEQLPVKTLKIFAQGNAMHEKWYKLFRAAKIDVAIERTVFIPEYDLSFTIDALLKLFGKEIVCDVKSMNTYTFKSAKSHPSGEKQVNFYLWALSHVTGIPHREGFVLADDKNNQDVKIFPVTYSKEKVKPQIECLKTIQVMKDVFINDHKAPERICDQCDCKRASVCAMKDACWNIGMGRVKLSEEAKSKAKQRTIPKQKDNNRN